MGNPDNAHEGFISWGTERLVVLSPFYVKAHEVTAAEYRASGQPIALPWSGTLGQTMQDYCTFTASPGPFDAYPMNCLPWVYARQFCRAAGGDLPTEAQFEYVAGGLSSNDYMWGSDPPACGDAVYARAGLGDFTNRPDDCRTPNTRGGPQPVGSGARDRLELGGVAVEDIAGNVFEWVHDTWQRESDPCWARLGVYSDPLCTMTSPVDGTSFRGETRGGSWVEYARAGRAASRLPVGTQTMDIGPDIGFRCVKPTG
jgi:formylglycine-generating enzyme required for sulfatase activity